ISASVELESGALGSFTASLGSADEITRIRLVFENVSFESDHAPYQPGTAPWTILPRSEEVKARIMALLADWQDVPPRFTTQMARFHDALMGRAPLPVTSADSRRALEIVTAMYHSSETREEVRLPIGADHPKYASWLPAGVQCPWRRASCCRRCSRDTAKWKSCTASTSTSRRASSSSSSAPRAAARAPCCAW